MNASPITLPATQVLSEADQSTLGSYIYMFPCISTYIFFRILIDILEGIATPFGCEFFRFAAVVCGGRLFEGYECNITSERAAHHSRRAASTDRALSRQFYEGRLVVEATVRSLVVSTHLKPEQSLQIAQS